MSECRLVSHPFALKLLSLLIRQPILHVLLLVNRNVAQAQQVVQRLLLCGKDGHTPSANTLQASAFHQNKRGEVNWPNFLEITRHSLAHSRRTPSLGCVPSSSSVTTESLSATRFPLAPLRSLPSKRHSVRVPAGWWTCSGLRGKVA